MGTDSWHDLVVTHGRHVVEILFLGRYLHVCVELDVHGLGNSVGPACQVDHSGKSQTRKTSYLGLVLASLMDCEQFDIICALGCYPRNIDAEHTGTHDGRKDRPQGLARVSPDLVG